MSDSLSYPFDSIGQSVKPFEAPVRMQTSVLSRPERRLLNFLCEILPAWVTSDHLTALGLVGAGITAVGYILSNLHPAFLFLASFGLVVHWFGDSLDGSLARYRKAERPRYGYFVDRAMDSLSSLTMTVGLGLSPYVGMGPALILLAGYLLIANYAELSSKVLGEFPQTYVLCGATELRLIIVGFNLSMYALGPDLLLFGRAIPLHSTAVGLLGAVLIGAYVVNVYKTAGELARSEVARATRSEATLQKGRSSEEQRRPNAFGERAR